MGAWAKAQDIDDNDKRFSERYVARQSLVTMLGDRCATPTSDSSSITLPCTIWAPGRLVASVLPAHAGRRRGHHRSVSTQAFYDDAVLKTLSVASRARRLPQRPRRRRRAGVDVRRGCEDDLRGTTRGGRPRRCAHRAAIACPRGRDRRARWLRWRPTARRDARAAQQPTRRTPACISRSVDPNPRARGPKSAAAWTCRGAFARSARCLHLRPRRVRERLAGEGERARLRAADLPQDRWSAGRGPPRRAASSKGEARVQ